MSRAAARVPVASPPEREHDGDRASGAPEPVERLVREVAAALGITAGAISIDAGDDGTRALRQRRAAGLSLGATVTVDPTLDVTSTDARRIVAHEVVHVAQRSEHGRHPGRWRPDPRAAEREAHRLADRFVAGLPLPRPLATLPTGHMAADVDWPGLDDLRAALDAFDATVADAHPAEWQTLLDAVSADGTVASGHVDLVVNTLAPLELPVSRALVHRLVASARRSLVRQIDASHRDVHRPSVIAILAALEPADVAALDADHFRRLDLSGLTTLEHDLLLLALSSASTAVITELLETESGNPDAGRAWHELVEGQAISITEASLIELAASEQVAAEAGRSAERAQRTAEADRVVAELTPLVDDDEGAVRVLDRIAELDDEIRRSVVAALERTGRITTLVDRLDDRAQDGGPLASDRFGTMMAARPVAANLATVEDRLSGGIFGWDWTEDIAITEADAMVAFWGIAALPLDVRERLLRSSDTDALDETDQGDVLDKTERNLPRWFVEGPAYRSLAVARDRRGERYERGARHREAWAREGTAGFLIEIRRLLDRGHRTEVLDALSTGRIPDVEAATTGSSGAAAGTTTGAPAERPDLQRIEMTDDVRAAIVDRLDALDVMDGFLEDLPFEVRQGRDHRMQLLEVCSARSVPNLLRHIDDLLHTGLDDWAVMSWEADLAFVLYRSLPPYEQQRFKRLAVITAEMSPEAITWSGTNLLDAAHARTQLESVRQQLCDRRLWTASHAGRLRVTVGLAVALGDRATAFERSREFRAFVDPALRPIVTDFRLYDPDADRLTYEEERLANRPWYHEGPFAYGTMIFGFLWVALRDAFAGDFAIDVFQSRVGQRRFDLNELGDLLGGSVGGARFAERTREDAATSTSERDTVSPEANYAAIEYRERDHTLHLVLPELALDGLGLVRSAWAANIGAIRVRGLDVQATFETNDMRYPRSVVLDVPQARLRDLLITTPESAIAAGEVVLDHLHLSGSPSTSSEHSRDTRGWWTYIPIFGPMIEYVRLLLKTLSLALNAADQIAAGATELRSLQVDIAGITVEGLLVGGVPIERVSVGPISIGWGGTRAAYLQHQERALAARLETAPEGPRRDRLVEQLTAVRAALPAALEDDRRLDELIRRSQRDPSSLTTDDHRAIRDLQRGPGGLIVDTGRIELHGIGDLAERATIERISGELSGSAATGGRTTDPARADRFATSGPPTTLRSRLEGEGRLDLGDVDVMLQPPSLETLQAWRRQAEAAGGTGRMTRLDVAIEQREELDRLRRSQDEAAREGRRADEAAARRIEELLGALATTIHAEGGHLRANTSTGEVRLGADRVSGGPIDTSGFGVGRVDVEGVSVPITTDATLLPTLLSLGDQLEGLDPAARRRLYGDRAHEMVTGAGLEVRRATLSDIRIGAGDEGIREVVIEGLSAGTVTPVDAGVRVEGFHVDSITGRGAQLRFGSHSIDAPGGVVFGGIDATFTILITPDMSFNGAVIDDARIETVQLQQPERPADAPPAPPGAPSTAPLSYTNLGSGFRVDVFDGGLGGIWLQHVMIDPDTPGIVSSSLPAEEGRDRPMAGIERIDGLRLAAAVAGYQVGTTLSSTPDGEGAPGAVTVGRAHQGGWFLDLDGLRLDASEVRSPDGSVRVHRLDWAHSHLRYDGEGIYLDALDVPLVEVGALRWRIGTAGVLSSVGGATIRGITATASARLVERDGETHVSEFELPELRVASISAEDIRYQDGPIDVQFRRLGITDPAPVSIDDIVLTGVRWRPGAVTTFDLRTGPLGLAFDAGSGGTVAPGAPSATMATRDWGFIGRLDATSIHVARDWTGTIEGGVEHLNASADVAVGGVGSATVAARDLRLPGLTFGGNVLSVPASAAGMLRLGSLELSAMSFSGGGVTVSTVGRSTVRLEELQTGFDIELVDVITAGRAATHRALSAITLHQVDARRLSTTGLRIELPGVAPTTLSTTVTVSTGARASQVTGIHVRNVRVEVEPKRGGGYRVTGWSYDELRLDHVELHDVAFDVPIDTVLGADPGTTPATTTTPTTSTTGATTTPTATSADWIAAFESLIDTANGRIELDLHLPVYLEGVDLGGRIAAGIDIVDGEVDFVELEAQILEDLNIADAAIDFEVSGHTLVIELDLRQIGPAAGAAAVGAIGGVATRTPQGAVGGAILGGVGGAAAGFYFSRDLVTWDLSATEERRARRDDVVRIARLLQPRPSTSAGPSPVEVDLANLTLTALNVNLSLTNPSTLSVTLPSSLGRLDFARNALAGLRIGAGVGLPARPAAGAGPARAGLDFSLDRLQLAGASLNLAVGTLTSGAMRVEDLRNGRLHLERLAQTGTTAATGRPHDTNLGLRIVNVTGNAGTIDLRDLVLAGGSSAP